MLAFCVYFKKRCEQKGYEVKYTSHTVANLVNLEITYKDVNIQMSENQAGICILFLNVLDLNLAIGARMLEAFLMITLLAAT